MEVLSAVPGRTRWHLPILRDRPALSLACATELERDPRVTSASANPLTGNLLVTFDSTMTLADVERLIPDALERALSAPPAPPPTALAPRGPGPTSLTRLLARTAEHRPLVRKMLVSAFFNRLLDSSPPILIGTGIDIVTTGRSTVLGWLGFKSVTSQLLGLGGLGLAIWAADATLDYMHRSSAAELANIVRHELRNDLYAQLQRLDVAQIEGRDVSEWINVIDGDLSRIQGFIKDGSDPIITIIANGVALAGTALTLSPSLALAQLVLIPPVVIASKELLGPLRDRLIIANQDANRLSAVIHGNVSSLSTIKSFGMADIEAERVALAGERHLATSASADRLAATYVPTLAMIVGSGFMATLVYGGMLVQRGKMAPGAYNIVGTTQLRMLAAIGQFGASLQGYQRTAVSLDRVYRILDMKPTIASAQDPVPFSAVTRGIDFDDVSFGYDADRLVLRDFNLTFPAGKTVGIVGSSGAGKSTVLKLLLRFYDVTGGAVRYDGVDVRDLRLDDLHHGIAMVSQELAVFAGTIRDNIAYARPGATDDDVRRAADVAEAHEFIEALSDGYDTVIGHGGLALSAGQRQRLAIARVVLADRPILVFDEATSALDYQTEASVQRSLQRVTEGRTTVIVAHRLSTIRQADLIYVLDDGQVKERGRHDDLIAADGIYAAMWKVQTGEIVPRAPRARPPRPADA
jgi:ATP-binding cassette, subfamily B, bacterial